MTQINQGTNEHGVLGEPLPLEQGVLVEVPPDRELVKVHRRRTGRHWREEDPETYEEVLERILGCEINISKLAQEFAPKRQFADGTLGCTVDAMRRAIGAMVQNDERLGLTKFRELRKLALEFTEAEMVDKVRELGAKAKKADLLGAAAMAMKMTRDCNNAQGGTSSIVIKHEHVVSMDDETARRREEIRQRLEAKSQAIDVAEVEDARE